MESPRGDGGDVAGVGGVGLIEDGDAQRSSVHNSRIVRDEQSGGDEHRA